MLPKISLKIALSSLLVSLLLPALAIAQVVVTLDVEEIYDDNIYLENDNGESPITRLSSLLSAEQLANINFNDFGLDTEAIEQIDGDPDDDLITNVTLTLSGALYENDYFKAAAGGSAGAIFFADSNNENRLTLDSVIDLKSQTSFIPQPFFLGLTSRVQSDSNGIGAAGGTAARQTQTHDGSLRFGIGDYQIMQRTNANLSYNFIRHDYLGDFKFDSEDSALENALEDQGADYNVHSINLGLNRVISERLIAGAGVTLSTTNFTDIKSNNLASDSNEDQQDRDDLNAQVGLTYIASEDLNLRASVGVDKTEFDQEREPRLVSTLNPDGSVTTSLENRDKDQTSFAFDLGADWTPNPSTVLTASAGQSAGTDIDGDRITARTFQAGLNRSFSERLSGSISGMFTQFEDGDDLSNATDRVEATIALSYNITEAIALSLGYNYIDQEADEARERRFSEIFLRDETYQVNRFFLSVSGGLIGN